MEAQTLKSNEEFVRKLLGRCAVASKAANRYFDFVPAKAEASPNAIRGAPGKQNSGTRHKQK